MILPFMILSLSAGPAVPEARFPGLLSTVGRLQRKIKLSQRCLTWHWISRVQVHAENKIAAASAVR